VRDALGDAAGPSAPLPVPPPVGLSRPASAPSFDWTLPDTDEAGEAGDLPEPPTPVARGPVSSAGRAVVAGAREASTVAETSDAAPPVSDESPSSMSGVLPALRPLGQVELTYIVAEAPDGLYLVDQHAAHERVLYEQVLARRAAGEAATQPLLDAAVVTLSTGHVALVEELAAELEAIGWTIEPADGAAVILRAVPAGLRGRDPAKALAGYLDRVLAEDRLTGPDRVAASLACRAAVMAGDRLEAEQQRALLRALEACETPHTCPHGRPTMLHLSRAALERSFGRR
jgi:DNA mismatch repair protein MutL